jgi:D-sedoheptulose 7-phosphate isomerase
MDQRLTAYFDRLASLPGLTKASDGQGNTLGLAAALDWAHGRLAGLSRRGGRVLFIGNGGSAAIASHCAIDYLKNGGYPTLSFNDGAALTCLGNDLGFDQVFARQIEMHARPGDLLVAISSSGCSPDILRATEAARGRGAAILTLSGFAADNPLRALGDINLYVPIAHYGFVEIFHLTLIHAILDLAMGWPGDIAL